MKTAQPMIVAKGLAAGYRHRTVWQDATFSIPKGEFVGVLGPNGAGKTTLFRLLLGTMKPLRGSITLHTDEPRKGHAHVGYVPQRRPVDDATSIEALEFVRLGLNGHHWGLDRGAAKGRKIAMKVLKSVDAEALAHQPLGSLSGGELQRIFLAQALVGDPEVLLLDEPLSNLDIRREASLVQLIHKVVTERGVTVLLIAHDLNPLLPVLDRVMYVTNGRIATGKPETVITSESLSELYGAPIEVLRDSHGRLAVLGIEEAAHAH